MKKFIITLGLMLFCTQAWAFEPPNLPADVALAKLKDGNVRFASYKMKHPNTQQSRREKLILGQHPYAVILTCSDSRVVPEIIFDQGLGDIFVIRNAGNVIDKDVMGSIEYAVHHLGVNLVVVLGHESCGAVGAAMKENKEPPEVEEIKESIFAAVKKCKDEKCYSFNNVIKIHAKLTANAILENEDICNYYKKHDLKIIPAYYNISTGEVEFLK